MILIGQLILYIEDNNMNDFYKILRESYFECISKITDINRIKYLSDKYIHSFEVVDCAYKIFGSVDNNEIGALLLHDIGYFTFYKNNMELHTESGYLYLKTNYILSEEILASVKFHESDEKLSRDIDEYCKKRNIMDNSKKISAIVRKVIDCDIVTNIENAVNNITIEETKKCINEKLIQCLTNNKLGKGGYINNCMDRLIYIICGLFLLSYGETIEYIKKSLLIEQIKLVMLYCYNNNKTGGYEQVIECLDNLQYEKNYIKIKTI